MRIIGGSIRGRNIPFVNSKYGNADITAQMVKEAYFDIIAPRIKGSYFLDLFSCSGQMGLEAWSRGAELVLLNERDSRRFSFINDMKKKLELGEKYMLSRSDAFQCLKSAARKGLTFDLIYCDPPYVKEHGKALIYEDLLLDPSLHVVAAPDCIITMQHFAGNSLPDSCSGFIKIDSRTYGQNSLTFYRRDDTIA